MKTYLIINADDFGLNKEINEGIINSFKNGCVTSASLITTEESFKDAKDKIEANPLLDIGIHLNIVRGQAKNNIFWLFVKRMANKKATEEKIYQQFEKQIKKALDHKIKITHLDTEKHLHIFPFILKIMIALAKKYDIKTIRLPFEKISKAKSANIRQLLKIFFSYLFYKKSLRLIKQSGLSYPDFFYGISLSQRFSLNNLKRLIDDLRPGISELSCHPALKIAQTASFIDQSRYQELQTLTNPALLSYIKDKEVVLTNFKIFSN